MSKVSIDNRTSHSQLYESDYVDVNTMLKKVDNNRAAKGNAPIQVEYNARKKTKPVSQSVSAPNNVIIYADPLSEGVSGTIPPQNSVEYASIAIPKPTPNLTENSQ